MLRRLRHAVEVAAELRFRSLSGVCGARRELRLTRHRAPHLDAAILVTAFRDGGAIWEDADAIDIDLRKAPVGVPSAYRESRIATPATAAPVDRLAATKLRAGERLFCGWRSVPERVSSLSARNRPP